VRQNHPIEIRLGCPGPITILRFWRPEAFESKHGQRTFPVAELPALLPVSEYSDRSWHVDFWSPSEKQTLFSVTLSRDLFDTPRKINIKLDPPKPQLRPFVDDWRNPLYTANISQRMQYRKLPYWDASLGKLISGTNVPELRVTRQETGAVVHASSMAENSCYFWWPQQWYAPMDHTIQFPDNTKLIYSVTYDSGGLFDTFNAKWEFNYHSALHGQ
jgi:hypothetical protein